MNRIRIVRAEKRISQFRLRLETGIHQSKISLIENDLVEPTKDEARKLAEGLGVSIGEIFGDEKIPIGSEEDSGAQESFSTGK